MALVHDFFSIQVNDLDNIVNNYLKINLREILENKDIISIHDDIVQFIFKTLNWIKTKDYKNRKDHDGLFYHGTSIIYPDQIIILKKIIEEWVIMLNYAPDYFLLNQYDEEKVKKERVILELNDFVSFLDNVIKDKNYLIHAGI